MSAQLPSTTKNSSPASAATCWTARTKNSRWRSRTTIPCPALPDGGANGAGEKDYRRNYFQQLFRLQARAGEAAGLGGRRRARRS